MVAIYSVSLSVSFWVVCGGGGEVRFKPQAAQHAVLNDVCPGLLCRGVWWRVGPLANLLSACHPPTELCFSTAVSSLQEVRCHDSRHQDKVIQTSLPAQGTSVEAMVSSCQWLDWMYVDVCGPVFCVCACSQATYQTVSVPSPLRAMHLFD